MLNLHNKFCLSRSIRYYKEADLEMIKRMVKPFNNLNADLLDQHPVINNRERYKFKRDSVSQGKLNRILRQQPPEL